MMGPTLFGVGDGAQDSSAGSPTRHITAGSFSSTVSLYRKYRPQSFAEAELVGQDHVVRTLRNAILLNRVGHAYLFSGPRGTGKTTTARVLAKAVNCLEPDVNKRPCNDCANCEAINSGSAPDVIEIDAASNRGIDDIRDLRERVRYAPAQLPTKVYIIDEAHQITGAAANAFLKTLEEPPSHTRFVLATTDPEELLPTIVSRCQRFEFRRVGAADIVRRLRFVAEQEGIAVEDDALQIIARHATGSLRDALGFLERLALLAAPGTDATSSMRIEAADVRAALGLSRNDRVERLVETIARRDAGKSLEIVQDAIEAGEDPRQLNRQLLGYLRMLLVERSGTASDADDRARELAAKFSLAELAAHARRFGEIDFAIKHAPFPQLPLEIALVEAASAIDETEAVADRRVSTDVEPQSPLRPTSLRDRVRAPTSIRELPPQPASTMARTEPVPITPLRSPASTDHSPSSRSVPAGSPDVEQIVDLWPSVRADVKALNRRIEALLSEVDPVAVNGNQVTLAVPYPFHRDKLNTDEVRETVAGVLSRLLGHNVSLHCILRGEVTNYPTTSAPFTGTGPSPLREPPQSTEEEDKRDQERLQAAKNIFDAEEIDRSAMARMSQPSGDTNA